MADETDNLILEHLRKIRGTVGEIQTEMSHMNLRIGSIERILSGSYVADVNQNAEIDRLKERVNLIERRLELNES